MVDVAMCHGKGCTRRDTCYRFVAKPDPVRQSYIAVAPDGCDFYWPVTGEREAQRLDIAYSERSE